LKEKGEEMAERGLEDGEGWVEKKSGCTLKMLMILVSPIKLHAYPLNIPTLPPPYAPTNKVT
jgi:hypothetical protein